MVVKSKSKCSEEVRVTFPPVDRVQRLSVQQYHRMIRAGILGEKDRVELLEGWIISKMTHNPPHDGTIQLIQKELLAQLPSEWVLRIQSAITLEKSEPEPDLAVVRGPIRRYLKAHPAPSDIGLLVEVAETTVLEDRNFKGGIYSRAFIPVYWLANLPESQIEVYTEPKVGRKAGYSRRQDFRVGDQIPLILEGREMARVSVRNLLP